MDKNAVTEIPKFWQERLAQLVAQPTLCIIGYEFHSDYYMPHFHDTICGEWSRTDSRLNPFSSESHYATVMGWADWRKSVITKFQHPENIPKLSNLQSLDQLRNLQQLFQFGIADQSPDGFLKSNHIPDVHEIYGNIHRGKCHACGMQVEQWQFDSSAKTIIACQCCGGRVFPDIYMLGWNERIETKTNLTKTLAEVENLLLIVPDKAQFPFNTCAEVMQKKRVVELAPKSIVVDDGKQTLHIKDIAKILGYREGDIDALNKSPGSLAETLAIFSELCIAWKDSSIA
jgi:NAD-dependent SIR2 family protein deacetylase